jgi:hypothetical protein
MGATFSNVTRGLDPRVHHLKKISISMDCRVKPGNDDGLIYAASAASFLPFSTASSMVPTM